MTDFRTAPFRDAEFMPVDLDVDRQDDGTIIFKSNIPMPERETNVARAFFQSAEKNAGTIALAQRGADGEWETVDYATLGRRIASLAAWLIENIPAGRAVMVLAENSIDSAIVKFACYAARVIHTPVSPAYALAADYARLSHVAAMTNPACIFAPATAAFVKAVETVLADDVAILIDNPGAFSRPATALGEIFAMAATDAVQESIDRINPDDVASYMMTSGSTGLPKVVQLSMTALAANTAQTIAAIGKAAGWDDVMLDWLPWHHAAGASVLRSCLVEGGSLYIDAGKPAPGLFDTSIRNLREISVCYFNNVPSGYAMLVAAMEDDLELRASFFKKMRLMLYGGAGLPQNVYDRLQEMAVLETGHRIHMTTGYGMTETVSGCLTIHYPTQKVGIGLPCPDVTVKLVPTDGRYEVRLRGRNLMNGYLNEPEKNAAVFDEQGFYKTGDLARLIDPDNLEEGLAFAGRLAEEFKLSNGTWVYGGELRDSLLKALAPDVMELVLCDANRPYLTMMAWPGPKADADTAPRIAEKLQGFNANRSGKSATIQRFALLASPPDPSVQEVSDKGSINRRAVIENRADIVEQLYADSPSASIFCVDSST